MTHFALPSVSDGEILALEEQVQDAQRRRSLDQLKSFGFGEVSIALGWPTDSPRFIAKRLIPMTDPAQIDGPLRAIESLIQRVEDRGQQVLATETRRVRRQDGLHVGYVVQPIVPAEQLAETVLTSDQPEAFHPLLVAVRDFVVACGGDDVMLDAQIPNFAWVGGQLLLLDVTSPATFNESGDLNYAMMDLSKQLVPAPLRPALTKASDDVLRMYRGLHGALTQVVVFLYRVKADAWVEPAIETFNEALDQPIDPVVVRQRWDKNQKDFPKIKRLLQIQRAWQENVRRRPYEYLITDSFTGEVL